MPDRTLLLATKIALPPVRAPFVPRPQLHARLAGGLRAKLTLVAAPAGWGKSSSVTAWLHEAQPQTPAAWVTLDAGDNDPQRFWSYVVAALETLQPDLAATVLPLLQTAQMPIEAVLTALLNALSGLETDVILVLDDYHVVDTPAIHEALQFLVDHLPPRLHLLLASRADPPLALARLRVRGDLVELRVADLRFTAEEAAQFLRDTMGLELTPEQVAVLDARTEGWIAGLQLAALAMQDRSDIATFLRAFSGSNRYVVDYLAEEVLVRLPAHLHTFLLQTSILDRLCAPLCDAVVLGEAVDPHKSYSQALLDQIERMNLFLVPLDDQRRWYRYHPLFADVLREQLGIGVQQHVLATLHHRASLWFERQGLVTEAVHHALIASDAQRAADLIERHAEAILKRGEYITLHAWLARLPDEMVQSRPRLSLFRAWTYTFTNNLEAAEHCLHDAEQAVQLPTFTEDGSAILGEVAAIRSGIALNRSTFPGLPAISALVDQALAGLPPANLRLRGMVMLHLGIASYWGGDLPGASQALAEAGRLSEAAGDVYTLILARHNHAVVPVAQGKLRQAAPGFRHALHVAVQRGLGQMPTVGLAHLGLANVLYEWNDLATATFHLREAIGLGTRGGNPRLLALSYTALARVLQAQADGAGALRTFQQAEQLAQTYELPPYCTGQMAACQVQLLLMQGDRAATLEWLAARQAWNDDALNFLHEAEHLARARVRISHGEADNALRLLGPLRKAAEAAGRAGSVLAILALEALAFQAHGDVPAALTALERALVLAEPEGYIRTFVDEGEPMRALLHEAAAHQLAPTYVARLLAAFSEPMQDASEAIKPAAHAPQPASAIAQPLEEALSERELEVLRLLATGLPNQAIAAKLIVGHNTVKKHLSNIYAKLGVQSRTEALARAHELHLL